jgi:hypothetical protein
MFRIRIPQMALAVIALAGAAALWVLTVQQAIASCPDTVVNTSACPEDMTTTCESRGSSACLEGNGNYPDSNNPNGGPWDCKSLTGSQKQCINGTATPVCYEVWSCLKSGNQCVKNPNGQKPSHVLVEKHNPAC